jgi:predicted outer membrane protein
MSASKAVLITPSQIEGRISMRHNHLVALAAAATTLCIAASVSTAQVTVTTSSGEVVTVTQKNVVNHMIVFDSLNLEMAKLAAARTENVAVKDFAKQIIADNTNHLEALNKLAHKRDIGREVNLADTSSADAIRDLDHMRSMAGDANFDKTFVREQILHDSRELDALAMLRPAAKDDDLWKDIDRSAVPALQRHLAQAKQVGTTLGMNVEAIKPSR